MQYSKIYKFVKDQDELKKIRHVLLDNFDVIYEQYVYG